MTTLVGRTALITGAGAGIGRGIALALAAAGARVALAVRRPAGGEETATRVTTEGGDALVVTCDVSQPEDVERAVRETLGRFGGLDIVVHNSNHSASSGPLAFDALTDERWSEQAAVAWDGALHLARFALAPLKASGRGRFVLLGSAFGLHGAGYNPVYSALKGGYRGLTKSLAREWGPWGITVNAIQPAAATEPAEVFFAQHPEFKAAYLKNFPMARMGRPREDIGGAVVALCSDECGFVTAQNLTVDGGLFTAV